MTKRMHPLIVLAAVLVLVALPGLASATYVICAQATGSVQGPILGTSIVGAHQNWIDCYSVQHGVSVPTGPTGLPSGPEQTTAVYLAAVWNPSTIKLLKAAATQETFSSFIIDVVDDPLAAKMAMTVIRYELINAHVESCFFGQEDNSTDLGVVNLTLSFSQLRVTDMIRGGTVTYDWTPFQSSTPETLAKGLLLAPTPNPTQGQAEFRFSLPSDSNARLSLFDLRGHLVRELYNGWTTTEPMTAVWDGTDDRGMRVAQGVYMARLTYPGREVTQRITVVR